MKPARQFRIRQRTTQVQQAIPHVVRRNIPTTPTPLHKGKRVHGIFCSGVKRKVPETGKRG